MFSLTIQRSYPLTWKYIDPPEVKWNLVDNHQEGLGPHSLWVAPMSTVARVGCLWWNCPQGIFPSQPLEILQLGALLILAWGKPSCSSYISPEADIPSSNERLSLICCFPLQLWYYLCSWSCQGHQRQWLQPGKLCLSVRKPSLLMQAGCCSSTAGRCCPYRSSWPPTDLFRRNCAFCKRVPG